MPEPPTSDSLIDALNRVLATDHDAVRAMVLTRFTCNYELARELGVRTRSKRSNVAAVATVGVLDLVSKIASTEAPNGDCVIVALFEARCSVHGSVSSSMFAGRTCPYSPCARQLSSGRLLEFRRTSQAELAEAADIYP